MNIKICGLRTKSAVDEAVKNGATHLGFILSKSRRQITPEELSVLTVDVPKSVKKVGVFVNESIEFVKNAVAIAGLDLVQLHGDEDMSYIRQLSVPVIKAVSDFAKTIQYENVILLLDSAKGGSGQAFDWKSVSSDDFKLPFFVAGGLNPDNVANAVQYFQDFPNFYGVDVSSGVETDGIKDLTKIRTFIKSASLARYDYLLTAFLTISQKLNAHGIIPYLMGSIAVQLVTGFSTNPDDIDIQLRLSDFVQFERLSVLMEELGYHLIDLHEHKFEKGNIHVGFANIETLGNYANVDFTALSKSELGEFYLPNLQQNIKIYEAAIHDSWRKGKHKDKLILEKLKDLEMDTESEVTIRPIQKADLRELWEISYGPKADLTWMTTNGPYFQDSVLTWEEFSAKITPKINQPNFALIIYQKRIVGQLSSYWDDGDLQKWLEFGLVIYDSKLWGNGIGTAVIPRWIKQLFDKYPEIQHLGFTTWSGNLGMMKLGEKSGLKHEGQIRKVRFWQGVWYDSVKYGILREEL